jgi:large subunit ribosomal protein L25
MIYIPFGEKYMNTNFELHAQSRQDIGKGASRRLRKLSDLVPAIIYGGEKAAESITIPHKDILKALKNEAFYSHILTLHVDKKPQQVVLKALQRHPVKPIIMHMDFLRISSNQKIHMHVPIHFTHEDTALGVKAGGIVSHLEKEIEITCFPADLPEFIEVNLSQVALDGSVHLADLTAPKGVEFSAILRDENPLLVSIHLPRIVEESTEESEESSLDASAEDTSTEE